MTSTEPYYEGQLTLLEFARPRARAHDPLTAHAAAESVKPGNQALVKAIRAVVYSYGLLTAFEIAAKVELRNPGRWDEGSIRSAVSRAGLTRFDDGARSPRGHRCSLYGLEVRNVRPL